MLKTDPTPASALTNTPAIMLTEARLAVLVPCRDEAVTIAQVVADFRAALPGARIFVYDNNSSDGTARLAQEAGAIVRAETRPGKGNVVRRMFADIEADAYILVDGDGTYEASAAPAMVQMLLQNQLDMVTGVRVDNSQASYRRGHRFGNLMLTGIVRNIFGDQITDMLSGYRVFSRRFVKSFPALSTGFETETEFTVHALELAMPLGELPTRYQERPEGSASKLRTYRDGVRILRTIVNLVREERPLMFFSATAGFAVLVGLALGLPVVAEFMRSGLVPRLPTAILAAAFVGLGFASFACGLILDSVARGRKEAKRIAYLSVPTFPTPQ
ncbi:glycosyltransferase [Acidisoma cellulosilytica]|uniref:Glycosyltransferase n=1 Tax=Acidisoma cellulosilyticum TaxID=2802395 RepID=A0A964E4W3_9PROT|nr:glycosyltransferase [Acidisoma cellulosilyticum]MCB8881792.1 glycosyltransferase [Acidisoma cellulosilyticum]